MARRISDGQRSENTVGRRRNLDDLLDRVNLPDVIAQECGADAVRGLNHERGGVIRDPRPGRSETHPSFSVFRGAGGRWLWKRHGGADDDRGNAFTFLLSLGYPSERAQEALEQLAGGSVDVWAHSRFRASRDPLQEARGALDRCKPLADKEMRRVHGLIDYLTLQDAAGRDLQRRGLYGWKGLQAGRLRHDFTTREGKLLAHAGALGILLRGPDGQTWGLKVRNLGTSDALRASGLDRYAYRIAAHGAPAWCSPAYGKGEAVLIVEGELNSAAAARALNEAGVSIDVQGLAGSGGVPFLHGLHGKPVFLYADPDAAGAACLDRLGNVARSAGAREVRVLPSLPDGDFCDVCGTLGAEAFAGVLLGWISRADYWQSSITGNNPVPEKNTVPEREKGLLANWQHISEWSRENRSQWTARKGGW